MTIIKTVNGLDIFKLNTDAFVWYLAKDENGETKYHNPRLAPVLTYAEEKGA